MLVSLDKMWWILKFVYIHYGMLVSYIIMEFVFYYKMEATENHYIWWNKPVRQLNNINSYNALSFFIYLCPQFLFPKLCSLHFTDFSFLLFSLSLCIFLNDIINKIISIIFTSNCYCRGIQLTRGCWFWIIQRCLM